MAKAALEPLVKGALSCWELRSEDPCALGITSLLGGRTEMALYPISDWASGCLLGTTHDRALSWRPSDSSASGLGLLILSQHLTAEAGVEALGSLQLGDVQTQPLGLGNYTATTNLLTYFSPTQDFFDPRRSSTTPSEDADHSRLQRPSLPRALLLVRVWCSRALERRGKECLSGNSSVCQI